MDSTTSDCDTADVNYIKRVKCAVAIAVIRNKPEDMSGEQYAKKLRETLQKREEDWKREAKRLEVELLTAKQELVKLKAEETFHKWDSRNLYAASIETAPDQFSDHFFTPPSSSETISSMEGPKIHREFNNGIRFLHCAMCLHNHNKTMSVFKTSESLDVLENSLTSVVDHLLENLEEIPSKDLNWAVEGVLKVVSSDLNVDSEKKLEGTCWRLIQGLLKKALIGGHNQPYKYQETLISQILYLCKVKSLLIPTLKLLIHQIVKLSEMLRQYTNKQCDLNVAQYENGCNAFNILEQLLSLSSTRENIKGEVAETMKEQLESSLLHITESFPLFAHYVWKLNSYMNIK
ncbi:meiosis-specific protein MEI4-like [Anneissia japonica]|uniref:meiosis-specific protein MEI4-like n=1 Tax=Anneissia japonica TaxID=1529436 RepID=UPI001425946D|nr:meiosis-specific protein MEI4-like [Anneissia japonica]